MNSEDESKLGGNITTNKKSLITKIIYIVAYIGASLYLFIMGFIFIILGYVIGFFFGRSSINGELTDLPASITVLAVSAIPSILFFIYGVKVFIKLIKLLYS